MLSLTRNGKPDAEVMDNLVYNYENEEGVLMSNKLLYIDDDPVVNPDYDDIRDQSVGNYAYDAVGNLTQDESEDIASISYSMSNKVVQINRNSTSEKQNIKYSYDAMGNRVMKKTWYPNGGTLPVYEKTWYVRDAQGNIMATYTWEGSNSPELQQQYIYGSQRLGYVDREGLPIPENIMHAIGLKKYELSNHLGNVLVTISDRPVSVVDESNTFIEGYTAEIVSAGDYYPGGSLMPGRNYSPDNYRFGYQGSEKSDEIAGVSGAHITTFFRENDTRILRWWSVDPKATAFESPYMSMGGNPIWLNDPLGDLAWKAEVDENGNTEYIAEKGDDFGTFMEQYNVTFEEASQIFHLNNFKVSSYDELSPNIEVGDRICGVGYLSLNLKKENGGWFERDYWSKKTQQRAIDHIDYTIKYAKANNVNGIPINKVFNYDKEDVAGFWGGTGVSFLGTLNNVPVHMNLSLVETGIMSPYVGYSDDRDGNAFGKSERTTFFEYRSTYGDLPVLRLTTKSEFGDILSKYLYE